MGIDSKQCWHNSVKFGISPPLLRIWISNSTNVTEELRPILGIRKRLLSWWYQVSLFSCIYGWFPMLHLISFSFVKIMNNKVLLYTINPCILMICLHFLSKRVSQIIGGASRLGYRVFLRSLTVNLRACHRPASEPLTLHSVYTWIFSIHWADEV